MNLGIVTPVPKGDWDSNTTYNTLNIVKYNNGTYIAKSTSTGIPPSSSDSAWMKLVDNEASPSVSTKAISEIVILASNENPHNLFGGEWLQIKGVFLYASEDYGNYVLGETGGEKTHELTITEMPSHTHNGYVRGGGSDYRSMRTNASYQDEWEPYSPQDINTNSGGGEAHNNMPPYLCVNIWQRIA